MENNKYNILLVGIWDIIKVWNKSSKNVNDELQANMELDKLKIKLDCEHDYINTQIELAKDLFYSERSY